MRFSCLAFVLSGQRTDTDDFLAKLQATLAIKRTERKQTDKTERTDDPTSKRPSAYTQRSAGAVPSSLCCTDTPAWYPERLGRLPRAVVSHLTVRFCCKERGSIPAVSHPALKPPHRARCCDRRQDARRSASAAPYWRTARIIRVPSCFTALRRRLTVPCSASTTRDRHSMRRRRRRWPRAAATMKSPTRTASAW